MDQFASFLASTVRMSTPLIIAGVGLVVAERAGIMNIGAEGIMLIGAFAAYAGTFFTGSYWLGLLVAIAASTLTTLIFAVSAITFRAQQAVLGAAMNIFGSGLTSVLFRKYFFYSGSTSGVVVHSFPTIELPLLSKIPFLGVILFKHNVIVFLAFILTMLMWFVMKRTFLGIKIISVGEHPRAADSLGINVILVRYLSTLFSGAMLGIAGAYLSTAQSNNFGVDMTSGRGFIALAVVILAKWQPLGVLAGAMIFGAATALQIALQNTGIDVPANLIMMIPYIVTVIAVLSVSKRQVIAPSAKGVPYEKN
ncbi:MAG: ABC transporter permease [Bacillota bacterium]